MRAALIVLSAFLAGVAIAAGVMLARPAPGPASPAPPAPAPAPAAEDEARRAKGMIEKADFEGAEKALLVAEKLDPSSAVVPLLRGDLAMARGNASAALRWYDEALGRGESREARRGKAEALFALGRHAGAVEEATRAGALFVRAAAHAALGENEKALRDYAAHLEANPRDAKAWVNRGNLELRMKMPERACASWRRAIQADPSVRGAVEPLIREVEELK
jgi:tetratricopeptide (TPR) repeat protein